MAYRPEWFPKCETNDAGILGIALNVVCFIRGSYETDIEDHYLNVRALEWVSDNWLPIYSCARDGEQEFDETIRKLINIALEMEKVDKKERGY